MRTSLKGRYTNDRSTAVVTVTANAGDVKLLASMSDVTFVRGPRINNLTFTVEKPGSFIIDYDVPKKVPTLSISLFPFNESPPALTSKLSASFIPLGSGEIGFSVSVHELDQGGGETLEAHLQSRPWRDLRLKYSYVHGGASTYEPCYDLGKNAWEFSVSRALLDDVFKATYESWTRDFALEWSRNSKSNGIFKISATVNMAGGSKMPKILAESIWELDL
ncbi:hypothetical protein V6N13_053977 [Hibiscus sabdariffa]|uniref:Uncharacterized protein n=1 Tax=Hibiscus sabdariffa TaxID=183260 RepID=A0ABR2T6M6_9ROSI